MVHRDQYQSSVRMELSIKSELTVCRMLRHVLVSCIISLLSNAMVSRFCIVASSYCSARCLRFVRTSLIAHLRKDRKPHLWDRFGAHDVESKYAGTPKHNVPILERAPSSLQVPFFLKVGSATKYFNEQ